MIGKPTVIPVHKTHPFVAFGTPKPSLLENRILSQPTTIIRQATLDMAKVVEFAKDKPSSATRVCYTGDTGAGKSHLLQQTIQHCYAQKWIVISIPRAFATVNSTTPHTYDLRTRTYLQPEFAYQTLQRILTVNEAQLSTLSSLQTYDLGRAASVPPTEKPLTIPAGSPLPDLIQEGLNDSADAPLVLDALMTELQAQEQHPVLLAIDDFQALFARTLYLDPHFTAIQSYHLSMPRLLMQFASGQRSFGRGAVFGALTTTNSQFPISNDVYLALDLDAERWASPYDKHHKPMQEYLKGILPLHIPTGMTPTEAAGLFEIWMGRNALFADGNDALFLSKYTDSNGNPRNFVWNGLLRSLEGSPLVIDRRKPYPQYNLA
ncbi:hypothetical protein BDZ89DRAFT_942526 [Hymenopellis radicata]|nr:hypothetical protein BDZ89DRAFT_942526 [Hymenopellis radicata]